MSVDDLSTGGHLLDFSILIASSGPDTASARCLMSLVHTLPDDVEFDVVFVDNGSTDHTQALLRRFEGDLDVIRNEVNLGMAAGLGQAVERSRGEILIAVRTDMVATHGWLNPLLRAFREHPDLQAARPDVIAPADLSRDGCCIAVRREAVVTNAGLPVDPSSDGDTLTDTERIGRRFLAWELDSRLVRESLLTTSPGDLNVFGSEQPRVTESGALAGRLAGDSPTVEFPSLGDPVRFESFVRTLADQAAAAPSDAEPAGSTLLMAVLFDGSRAVAERAAAGAILYGQQPTDALAATLRPLLSQMTADRRELVADRLTPPQWRARFDTLLADVHAPDERPLFWGLPTSPPSEAHPQPTYEETVANLQLFNDVMAASPLSGRYWIYSGMLLGWAREHDLIKGDYHDFDFAYNAEDWDRLREASVELVKAGFLPRYRYPIIGERCTVLVFLRGATKFEIYRMDTDGPDHLRSYSYGSINGVFYQNVHRFRRQPLVPIDYLDRIWLKSLDHETELTDDYGDWHIPDPDWDYMQTHSITHREPWSPEKVYDPLWLALA